MAAIKPTLNDDGPMSVADLFRYQRAFTLWAGARIAGVGAEQYDDGEKGQRFEGMAFERIATGLSEELADIVNYAVMLDIKMQRLVNQERTLSERADG